ncbi:phage/plasmid primase, P4 family [Mammaliicoccus lentus]|uniref:phage/plasmid primase, P4 family n=1 Tax=Mammaliicoccus lentus TaxID=42858 RepID=UPI002649C6A9|nr:phage/plasmid primase, P4 family [Mammaliicoccus lentus]
MAITTKEKILKVNKDNVPNEMAPLEQWVLWKAEKLKDKDEYAKVPYQTIGIRADSTKPHSWSDFEKTIEYIDGYEGIGFVLTKDDDYICLDLDDIHIDSETYEPITDIAKEVMEKTWWEVSPSGTGVHAYFKGTLPEEVKRKNKSEHLELYSHSRFMTFTGVNDGVKREILRNQPYIDSLVERYFKREVISNDFIDREITPSNLDDVEVMQLMARSKDADKISKLMSGGWQELFESQSEADLSLLNALAFYTQKNAKQMDRIFRNSDLIRNKWDKLRGNETYGQKSINKAINDCINVYDPNYKTSNDGFNIIINEKVSVKDLLIKTGKEERERLIKLWEDEGKNGRKPSTIGTNRCAYILNNLLTFKLFDLEENTKLAMYQIDEGIYTQNRTVIKRVISWLEPRHNERKAEEVIYHLSNIVEVITKTNEPYLIPVNNGVFNRKTKLLEPFTPNYVFTTKISTNYVDSPKMPTIDGWSFDNWLYEIACADREVYTLLWQVINDSLNGNYTRKKAIFLVGDGNNGKGTFQNLLSNLIGFDNIASLKVNEFDQEFKLGVLEGKTLVIGDDVPVGVNIEDSSNFNSVVTGDSVLVNLKNKQPYRAVFRTTVIQSTNGMPRFKNKTGGTNRRLLIVPFNADFNGTKENSDIKEKYLCDKNVLEYVLHKAINLEFNKFIEPRISSKMLEEYKQDNDPVYDFKVTEFDIWKIEKVPKTVVYYKYKNFCEHSGYRPLSERKFYKSFEKYLSNHWKIERPRYYSVNELQAKIGYFEPTLLPNGEQKKSYVNTSLKVV